MRNTHISKFWTDHSLEIYLVSCMVGVIPVIATNAIVQSFSLFPILGIGEQFGWTGVKADSVRLIVVLPLVVALAAYVQSSRAESLKFTALHAAAFLPSILLLTWCQGTIGSVMQYDPTAVKADPLPQPQFWLSPLHWFEWLSPLPVLMDTQAAVPDIVGRAKIELVNRLYQDRINNAWNLPYYIASAGLVFLYLWKFGFRRAGLAIVLGLSFLVSLFANSAWAGSWSMWFLASAYPIASFALLCILVRFAFRAYLDNVLILERFKENGERAKTFLYWIPFVVALVGTLSLGLFINNQIEKWTYNPPPIPVEDIPRLTSEYPDLAKAFKESPALQPVLKKPHLKEVVPVHQVRDDISIMLIGAFEVFRSGLTTLAAEADPDKWKASVLGVFDKAIRPSLEHYSPSFRIDGNCIQISWKRIKFRFGCLARDLKNSILNSIYQVPKNAVRNLVSRTIDKAVAEFKDSGAAQMAAQTKTRIISELDSWRLTVRQGVDLGWLALALASFLGVAILVQSVIRALLIIIGRLLVRWDARDAQEERNYFSMSPTPIGSSGRIDVKLAEQGELELPLRDKEVFYVKHSLDVANANRNVCFPIQPFSNVFSRIFNRRYFLKRLERNSNRPLKITDVGSSRFVAIRLKSNDRIAFRWTNFVGMTDNATIEYLLSLRPTLLVLGHPRIPTLKGPGLLVLKVSGAASVARRGQDTDTVAPYRLIAWDMSAWFRIASSRNFFSMYVDDCQIDIFQDDQAIFDIARDGRSMPGLFHQLWNTVRP